MHEMLVKKAKRALEEVHGDQSVPLETTRESLRDLREQLNILIEAIEYDIANRDRA